MSEKELAICGVEVWIATTPGPTIPLTFIYTWQSAMKSDGEAWGAFVERINADAREYVACFKWDEKDLEYQHSIPYFNLEVCSEAEWRNLTQ